MAFTHASFPRYAEPLVSPAGHGPRELILRQALALRGSVGSTSAFAKRNRSDSGNARPRVSAGPRLDSLPSGPGVLAKAAGTTRARRGKARSRRPGARARRLRDTSEPRSCHVVSPLRRAFLSRVRGTNAAFRGAFRSHQQLLFILKMELERSPACLPREDEAPPLTRKGGRPSAPRMGYDASVWRAEE